MAMRIAPDGVEDAPITCIICLQQAAMDEVTAGSLYADGRQAFACNKHLGDRTRWITAWSIFDAKQRHGTGASTTKGDAPA